jgi:predicted RNA-binding protein with PIN domain
MAVHLIIDGYNLIRQSPMLKAQEELALELGRDELLESLRQYKRIRAHRITVVFDAAQKPQLGETLTQQKGIAVIYSRRGETADSVIKRLSRQGGGNLLVVTSDRDLANYVEAYGAVTIDSAEFEQRLEMTLYMDSKGAEEEDELPGRHSKRGTRKKGPARRQPKKERRRQERWRKL